MNIIYEYQNIEDNDFKKYVENTPLLHKYFKMNWGILKSQQYCGIISYLNKDFYILPKISNNSNKNLDIFIYMLLYSHNINIKNEDLAHSSNYKSNNIFEIFIQLFARKLFKELKKGVYKSYIIEKDNLKVLRGKYLINENLKYNFSNSKIYCEYDEFSQDNKLNQLFLYAIKNLIKYTKNKKLLKHCELIFDEVECRHINIDNINIHFNRLNIRFKESFELAILLLKKLIPTFAKDKKSFAFLFDMNILFENFIGNIYKSIDNNTKLQYQKSFGNLTLKPDIYTSNLIIDIKYKKVKDKGDLNRDDKYQMFVYGSNFGVKGTMLLYPKHIKDIKEDLKLGEDNKMIGLKMRTIDLDFEGSYSEYIEEIRNRLKDIK